jgi:hypothetical protein
VRRLYRRLDDRLFCNAGQPVNSGHFASKMGSASAAE